MKLRLLLLSCALSLAACVDNGNKLEKLRFTTSSDVTTAVSEVTAYECFVQLPTLIGEFSDGSLGDFSQRIGIAYTSSDPAVLEISTGNNIETPDSTPANKIYYARGVMVPRSVGSTTITGSFAGLTASVIVNVHASSPPVLSRASSLVSGDIYVAPSSAVGLKAMSTLDGRPSIVNALGVWTVTPDTDDPLTTTVDESVAKISVGGVVSAVDQPTALPMPISGTATFTLPLCGRSDSIPFTIAPLSGIRVEREFDPGSPVLVSLAPVLATTELMNTIGEFSGGSEQDLNFQAVLELVKPSDNTVLADTTGMDIFGLNLLRAKGERNTATPPVAFDPVVVRATMYKGSTTNTPLMAYTESISAQAANLQSVTLLDENGNPLTAADMTKIAPFSTYQFHARGNFLDADDGVTTLTQEISRLTSSWSVSDVTVAAIGNDRTSEANAPGLATSIKNADGCVTVTFNTGLSDTQPTPAVIQATTLLGIELDPGTPIADPCTPSTTPTS